MRNQSVGQAATQGLLCLVFWTACGGEAKGVRIVQRDPVAADGVGGASSHGGTASASGGALGLGGGGDSSKATATATATAAGGAGSGGGGTGEASGGGAGAPIDLPCDLGQLTRGALELITVGPNCTAADGDATSVSLSGDGRYVAFNSDAADLVGNDMNGNSDAFIFDRQEHAIERISIRPNGEPIVGHAFEPRVSDNGRWVSFVGFSPDLVTFPALADIKLYLRDRDTDTTAYLDGDYVCGQYHRSSSDANIIVWEGYSDCQSGAGEFDILMHHRTNGQTLVLGGDDVDNSAPAVSADGKWVAWSAKPPDTAGQYVAEMALFEVATGELVIVPIGNAFKFSMTALSDDARVISFSSNGQFYWYEHASVDLRRISTSIDGEAGNEAGYRLDMSRDGRYVVFASGASDLVEGDTNGVDDIFLYDAVTEELERISVAPDGSEPDDESSYPSISGDGRLIGFASQARNLHPASTQGNWQVYVAHRELL